jgi:transposase
MVAEQGYTYDAVSRQLGVNLWTLRDWVRKYRKSGEVAPKGSPAATGAEELKQLQSENRRLRVENDILKKATAYFAKDSL